MAECKTAKQYSHAAGGRRCVRYILCLFAVCACRQVCLSVYMGVGMCAHACAEAREQLSAIIPQKPATLSLGTGSFTWLVRRTPRVLSLLPDLHPATLR